MFPLPPSIHIFPFYFLPSPFFNFSLYLHKPPAFTPPVIDAIIDLKDSQRSQGKKIKRKTCRNYKQKYSPPHKFQMA